jgi:P-type Cu+ transporter
MVGTGVGATQGVLIKGGAVLETMHAVDTVIFDKTGTLTSGVAVLKDQIPLLPDTTHALLQGLPSKLSHPNVPLWLAACCEFQSEHPLAKAIVNTARSQWGNDVCFASEDVVVSNFQVVPGHGVECTVSKPGWGTWIVRVGNRTWTLPSVTESDDHSAVAINDSDSDSEKTMNKEVEWALEIRRRGQIAVYVSVAQMTDSINQDFMVIAVMGVADPVCAEARSTVQALHSMGIDVWLCTGDHKTTALAVAEQVGIDPDKVFAGALPQDKSRLVADLQQPAVHSRRSTANRVAFVGDGINDAVALAKADVGIAIGAGTEIAVEAADVVLVRSSLHDVVVALHLSRVVYRRILLNFGWALVYNMLALPFAAGLTCAWSQVRLPPEMAGMMMAASSVSVVTSSLLLKNYQRPLISASGHVDTKQWRVWTWMRQHASVLMRWGPRGGRYDEVSLKVADSDIV